MNTPAPRMIFRHIVHPALLAALFFAVALSPVNLLGCATRGLAALVIALACGIGGVYSAVRALKGRTHWSADAPWWMISTIILAVPVVGMIILA